MHFRPIALLLATATLLACGSETPPPPGCDAGCSADGSVPFDPVTGCPSGFAPSADRTACVDVDECAAAGACAAGLTCVNEAGSFSCRCPEGFVGDEEGCSRLVDCAAEPTACHASASCVVTAQGRACVCDPGFVGDGTTCAATGYKLGLVKSSFDAYAGACVGPFELLKRDPDGYVDDFAGETLQLAGEGARFFADAACTTAIDRLATERGQRQARLYARADAEGVHALRISHQRLGSAAAQIAAMNGPPVAVSFGSTPASADTGNCVAGEVRLSGASGAARSYEPVVVKLSSDSAQLLFATAATCQNGAASVTLTLPAREEKVSFWFRSPKGGAATLKASADGLADGTHAVTLQAIPPTEIRFDQPSYGGTGINSCIRVGLLSTESSGGQLPVTARESITLSTTSSTLSFFTDANCSVPGSTIAMAEGTSAVSFGVRGAAYGTSDIKASASTLGEATTSVSVQQPYDPCTAGSCRPRGCPTGGSCFNCCSGACGVNYTCY